MVKVIRTSKWTMEKVGSWIVLQKAKEVATTMRKEKSSGTTARKETNKERQLTNEVNQVTTESRDIQKDRVEAVLHKSSRELAAVLLLMPPIVRSNNKSWASLSMKTKDSFDTSFSTLDSDVDTIEDWLGEVEEELVGLQLLSEEE